ncbi:MAG: ribonuclease H family protein [Candidatus Thorarchaeota archaeon SMTZ1-45]
MYSKMSFEIHTEGSCIGKRGSWSYRVEHRHSESVVATLHSDSGEASGTTDIQMKLMAILKALAFVRSIVSDELIIIKSDCALCIKCITREFDCTSDDAFKRDKVTRGFVQYLQEIWWKMSGLNVQFECSTDSVPL